MNNKIFVIIFGLSLFATTSCSKLEDFGDTNVNPGGINDPIPGALLTNVLANLSSYATSTRGGLYCQYFSETQYTDVSLYSLPQISFSGEYSGLLMDLQNIINLKVNDNMTAVSRITKAYIFWNITDRWGEVPYSEALLGKALPKYDTQEDIYRGILKELTEASAQFNNSGGITGDIIFGGSTDKWKKVANSLRLFISLRLSNKFPASNGFAATEFKAALTAAGGIITTNADNWVAKYPGDDFKSPWWGLYDGRKDFAESKTMTDLLGSLGDGRSNAFGGATEDLTANNWNEPSTVGVPYGLKRASAETFTGDNPTWARILRGNLREADDAVVIVSAAEVLLARAEAADRGWTSETALTLYQDGIKASFEQWGLSAPAAGYFTQSNVAFTAPVGTGANLKQIATQRYIATYPDGLQGWAEWRRTGYPVLTPAPDATNASGQIPTRFVYHSSEFGTNKAAVEEAVKRIPGGDTQDSKVWWDQ
ncbi:SusD/RagB family nutrient-binding outer membrane lipoprotein [Pseudoflavitalea sp. X16]|uniref:SusD/RagB family nutrient-binding outer membrane lipoprotein n=1 Tax=Paraflavitalea devenefica TaxID=2716334 RepID=UPI001424A1A7|nr:SusD/RagB family nutrient-binding outer membrane lipoprotein [Paraflavitalea devenefica]NII29903.1 SusD/RagB family nutrient-binding outer membrane lipoprotein [Paraflavitalea devenefica]